MSKTTLDLSTLSDITDGTHTVKVKAKADGYRDSEFSNEVSYTKAAPVYTATFTSDFSIIGDGIVERIDYKLGNETKQLTVNSDNYTSLRNTSFEASEITYITANADYSTITINGVEYAISSGWGYDNNLPYTLSGDVTISKIYSNY